MKWPVKKEREALEIQGFIKEYKRLSHGRDFVVEEEGECPDRIVRDVATNERFGIELTSIYLDDRSVPDCHINDDGPNVVPFDPVAINQYEKRILAKIIDKICKARQSYRMDYPLILSVYVNDYVSLYMGLDYWESVSSRYNNVFDCFAPFDEIVFWPLPNSDGDHPLVISARIAK
jgi:hypothetical protein